MRTPRILILVLFFVACLFLFCRSITSIAQRPKPALSADMSGMPTNSVSSFFSFNSGFSLFSPNAVISLTDDNSTLFPAQPAAFGPLLPHHGLSGRLWIGSAFLDDDDFGDEYEDTIGGTELGCSDIPGWHFTRPGAGLTNPDVGATRSLDGLDDADEHLLQPFVGSRSRNDARAANAVHARVYPPRQSADISGSIVLLSRGGCGFLEKVMWAQRRGASALIVGDSQKGGPLIQMFARGDTSNVTIPSVFTARTTARILSSLAHVGSLGIGDGEDEEAYPFRVPQSTDKRRLHSSKVESTRKFRPRHLKSDLTRGGSFSPAGTHWLRRLFGWDDEQTEAVDASYSEPLASAVGQYDDSQHQSEKENMVSVLFGGTDGKLAHTATGDIPMPKLHAPEAGSLQAHDGLWVTITPSDNGTPFFDTLLVLVISPLVTLTFVYAILILRARLRRRRWRAPKSVVEQLPVRTYHTVAPSPIHTPRSPSPVSSCPTTPLLQQVSDRPTALRFQSSGELSVSESHLAPTSAANIPTPTTAARSEREKALGSTPSQWKKYMGRQVECVVCLEEYENGVSQVMSLPCGHEFHADCITPWLTTRRRTCPICKGDVVRSLARGSSSGPTYEPYHDESDDEDAAQASSSGGRDEDVEQGILSPSPGRRESRAEAWLNRLSASFGATIRTGDPSHENRSR
ncbi:hypothetical protein VDGE_02497 [Verticillium dahliae]|uniref:RING-type E3 ubiquitin transferase n=1 Tax=Verticillium dahliae TaxID=27337 RepID=A0A444RUB3_VERDA|nr:hypothetical protein VDGE_02497 [Verticillium dahliae]